MHLEIARKKLGGREDTDPSAGRVVSLGSAPGVVLFASATEVDVWIGEGRVQRVKPAQLTPWEGEVPPELAHLAADARVYGALSERQQVVHQDRDGTLYHGQLVEKCRYGALVADDDGKLRAVGFRRLWPAPGEDAPS